MSLHAKLKRKNKLKSSKQQQLSRTVNPINKRKVSNSNENKPQYFKVANCSQFKINSTIELEDNKYRIVAIDRARKCLELKFIKSGITLNLAS